MSDVEISKDGVTISANLGEMFNNYDAMSYQLPDALAELIDNSFDSFVKNKKELNEAGNDDFKVIITINSKRKTVIVHDNAFGMDGKELANALIPDRKNPDPANLGMYGRGMKTGCGWFGKIWQITTKKLGSDTEYTAVVDIEQLLSSRSNFIPIVTKTVPGKPSLSYTTVTISKGNREYHSATTTKAKKALSIKYQRFLGKGGINIQWISGSTKGFLEYVEPNIHTVENPEYDEEKARTDKDYDEPQHLVYDYGFKFELENDNGKHPLTGRVGIYPPQGSQTAYSGLTMFWRNRVIIDRNRGYWPEVLGQAVGDLRRQRVFIHINTDMEPTSDKKDFKWDKFTFDELDIALSTMYGGFIKEISGIGLKLRKDKEKDLTPAEVQAELQKLKKLLESQATTDAMIAAHPLLSSGITELTDEQQQHLDEEESPEINIKINQGMPTLIIKSSERMHPVDPFCKITLLPDATNPRIKIYVNTSHSFYERYCKPSSEANSLFLKVVSCLALAKWSSALATDPVPPDSYLKLINTHLDATASEDVV